MEQSRTLGPEHSLAGSSALEKVHGFAPWLASEAAGWSNLQMRLWRGTVDTCSYDAFREVTLVLHTAGGGVRCAHDGRWMNGLSHPGALTIVPALNPITWDVSGAVESCTLHLPPERFENLVDDADSAALMRVLDFEFAGREPFIGATVQQLIDELRHPSPRGALYADTLADAAAGYLVRRHARRHVAPRSGARLPKPVLRRVLEYIESGLGTALTLDELARVAGLSRPHFNRCFVGAMGMPAYRYVQQRRLELARALLARSRLSLAQVALACGFSSQAHFGQFFKMHARVTPRQFRIDPG